MLEKEYVWTIVIVIIFVGTSMWLVNDEFSDKERLVIGISVFAVIYAAFQASAADKANKINAKAANKAAAQAKTANDTAKDALNEAEKANMLADGANTIAKNANAISFDSHKLDAEGRAVEVLEGNLVDLTEGVVKIRAIINDANMQTPGSNNYPVEYANSREELYSSMYQKIQKNKAALLTIGARLPRDLGEAAIDLHKILQGLPVHISNFLTNAADNRERMNSANDALEELFVLSANYWNTKLQNSI